MLFRNTIVLLGHFLTNILNADNKPQMFIRCLILSDEGGNVDVYRFMRHV